MVERARRRIPEATVTRLPVYLRILYELANDHIPNVSSERLAELAGVNAAKVRKDLSYLGSYGTRGVGYDVEYLLYQMSRELGPHPRLAGHHRRCRQPRPGPRQLRRVRRARLPRGGAGRRRPGQGGHRGVGGIVVRHLDDLPEIVPAKGGTIGVIATPPGAAQEAADRLVRGRRHVDLELRPGRADRSPRRVAAQGRPRRRDADPELLPAAPQPAAQIAAVALDTEDVASA